MLLYDKVRIYVYIFYIEIWSKESRRWISRLLFFNRWLKYLIVFLKRECNIINKTVIFKMKIRKMIIRNIIGIILINL